MSKSTLAKIKGSLTKTQKRAKWKHLVVNAFAGTGKTFSLVLGVAYIYRDLVWDTVVEHLGFEPIPSEEQKAIWEEMALQQPKRIIYVAFNKSIVTEFEESYSWLVKALAEHKIYLSFSTCHSLGFRAACKAFDITWRDINGRKTVKVLEEHLEVDLYEFNRNPTNRIISDAVIEMVRLCKLSLISDPTVEDLESLVVHYGLELGGSKDKIFDLVPTILEASIEKTDMIDFDDQVCFSTFHDLPVQKYDLVLGDEAQDWNKAQQSLILKAAGVEIENGSPRCSGRLVACGDVHQAIYGWAGADVDSIPNMVKMLDHLPQTVKELSLTVTRRCAKKVVEQAQMIVPEFKAHQDNHDGIVTSLSSDQLADELQPGDMVPCRVNAPLVSLAFKLLKMGKKAAIKGRDLGQGLINLINKLKGKGHLSVSGLIDKVEEWHDKEAQKIQKRKRGNNDTALIALGDKRDCIISLSEGCETVPKMINNIKTLFEIGKKKQDRSPAVLLTSIHRCKGLEAKRVFIIHPELLPHPMASTEWGRTQEMNLKYVAITRAIEQLTIVLTD